MAREVTPISGGISGSWGVCTAALVTAAGLVAALAACGSTDSGSGSAAGAGTAQGPTASVRGAADALANAGSSKARTALEMVSGGTKVTIHGQGKFDYGKRVGLLDVTPPKGAAAKGSFTELVVPGAVYMRNRSLKVPAGKWVRVPTASLTDGNLVTSGATDPITAAELLRGAQGVKLLQTTTLNGVKVRHYRGTADIARAAGEASEASGAALRAAVKGFTVTKVPFDAYLDDQGRLRQVRNEFTFRSASGEKNTKSTVTVISVTSLYAFGTDVKVTMPKSADVYDGKIVSPAVPPTATKSP